jgi:hypothetical protein
MKKKYSHYLPKGWTLEDVQSVVKHYDRQTDEEAAAEIESAEETDAVVVVPRALLPRIRRLVAESRARKSRRVRVRRVA